MGTQQYLQGILQIIIQGCDAYNLKIKSNQTLTLAPDQINILSPASNTNEKVGSRDEVLTSTYQAKKKKRQKLLYLSINTCIPKEYSWSVQMIECELINQNENLQERRRMNTVTNKRTYWLKLYFGLIENPEKPCRVDLTKD